MNQLKHCGRSIIFVLFLACSPLAAAQQSEAEQALDRIQQEQLRRLEREREEHRAQQPWTVLEGRLPTVGDREPDSPCRDIFDIFIDGADLMTPDAQDRATRKFSGRCLDTRDMESLLRAVTTWYIDRGYVAARAYVQTQDLKEGILRILVVEGRVEEVRIAEGSEGSVNSRTAFPGLEGKPLNLRDIEQGLDQINRLGSNNARMELLPGSEPGDSVVLISNVPGRRLVSNFTYDNYGSDSTGEIQGGVTLSLDNGLGINDGVSLTYRRTLEGDFATQHSQSTSLLYSIPFGYVMSTFSQVFSDYTTPVSLPDADILAEGKTRVSSLQLDYVALRDRVNLLSLSGTLTLKTNDNFLAGQRLATSSRELANLDLGLDWRTRLWGGSMSTRVGAVQGLAVFGAHKDPADLPDSAPHAQYTKWRSALSWNRPFAIGGQPALFGSSINLQWSDRVLYGSDQMLVGGVFSVRGFRNNSVSGQRGYYWRNDLSLPVSFSLGGMAVNLRPYLGADFGETGGRLSQSKGSLGGAAFGLAASMAGVNLDVLASVPLKQPAEFEDEGVQLFANFSYRL